METSRFKRRQTQTQRQTYNEITGARPLQPSLSRPVAARQAVAQTAQEQVAAPKPNPVAMPSPRGLHQSEAAPPRKVRIDMGLPGSEQSRSRWPFVLARLHETS
jgi:hypothetical protein